MNIFFLFVLVLFFNFSYSQKRSKKTNYPSSTVATERFEGYDSRLEIEKNSIIKNIFFRNIGPTVMSGRVTDLSVNPNDPSHFYVAYASGGLWETKNHGNSFKPIFDNQMVMTIGDITVDWENNIIYVGTGENNSSRSSYSGNGIYKSINNGKDWMHLGLEESHHIGRIVIHPEDRNTIWVASLGHLYSNNNDRGLYKTTDGGKTWKNTLFVNDMTGAIDLVIDPSNPDRVVKSQDGTVEDKKNKQDKNLVPLSGDKVFNFNLKRQRDDAEKDVIEKVQARIKSREILGDKTNITQLQSLINEYLQPLVQQKDYLLDNDKNTYSNFVKRIADKLGSNQVESMNKERALNELGRMLSNNSTETEMYQYVNGLKDIGAESKKELNDEIESMTNVPSPTVIQAGKQKITVQTTGAGGYRELDPALRTL